jgi:hypothetical protein
MLRCALDFFVSAIEAQLDEVADFEDTSGVRELPNLKLLEREGEISGNWVSRVTVRNPNLGHDRADSCVITLFDGPGEPSHKATLVYAVRNGIGARLPPALKVTSDAKRHILPVRISMAKRIDDPSQ